MEPIVFCFPKMSDFTGEQNQHWRPYLWGATKTAPHVWNVVPFRRGPRNARTMCVPVNLPVSPMLSALMNTCSSCRRNTSVEFMLLLPLIQLIYSISSFQPINKCLHRKAKNLTYISCLIFWGRLITNNQPHIGKGLVLQILYENTKNLDSMQWNSLWEEGKLFILSCFGNCKIILVIIYLCKLPVLLHTWYSLMWAWGTPTGAELEGWGKYQFWAETSKPRVRSHGVLCFT